MLSEIVQVDGRVTKIAQWTFQVDNLTCFVQRFERPTVKEFSVL